MSNKNTIFEHITSSRNMLLNGRPNVHVEPCLKLALSALSQVELPYIRAILETCLTEVLLQIERTDFRSAGLILNLIHNLPYDQASEERWDIDYFLGSELCGFLERFNEINSSRKITLCVMKNIGVQHTDRH